MYGMIKIPATIKTNPISKKSVPDKIKPVAIKPITNTQFIILLMNQGIFRRMTGINLRVKLKSISPIMNSRTMI